MKNHTQVLCSVVIFLHWLNTYTPYTRCTCTWYTTTTAITQTTGGSTRKSNHVLWVGPSFDLRRGSGGGRRREKKQTVRLPSKRAFLSTGSRRTLRTKLISFVGFFPSEFKLSSAIHFGDRNSTVRNELDTLFCQKFHFDTHVLRLARNGLVGSH